MGQATRSSADTINADTLIRRATPEDARALAAFAARTFIDTYGAKNDPRDIEAYVSTAYGEAQQARELADPGVVTLVATASDAIQAFAQVRRKDVPVGETRGTAIEIQRFYVDGPAQGTGLAARLMEAAMDAARDLRGDCLWLGVWERNPRAIAFYTKAGFSDVGTHDFHLGNDRQTDRILALDLQP